MSLRTTVLTNIFNEEYLLPFWLNHHKDMFDHGIIVDYRSTDKSLEICRAICPTWEIRTTRNSHFDAENIDAEFIDIEQSIDGIKIVLNTTEFLFSKTSIKEAFIPYLNSPMSLSITCNSPYSLKEYNITNNYELFNNLLNNDDIVFHKDRMTRQLHNFPHGNYTVGRHDTRNPKVFVSDMHVIWLGYYPMNDKLMARKVQIGNNMPQRDKDRGLGIHHTFPKEQLLGILNEKATSGLKLQDINMPLYDLLKDKLQNKKFIVTGGCGFIGSHMVDKLIDLGHTVIVFDNLLSGNINNLNKAAQVENIDICNFNLVNETMKKYNDIDGIFHFAAIARTPWCIDDPVLCYNTNVMGTLHILEAARQNKVKRVVLSSSNVVYAFLTPYRTSKEAVEDLGSTYNKMYNMSVISLRYSNVYGPRQSESGPSPNVFAALRKSKKDNGKLILTGDGTQTRNYTHVSDIVNGNLLAMFNSYCGVIDLCTGISVPLNEAAAYFDCPIEYIDERPGDIKHIIQSPEVAFNILGWKAQVMLNEGIKDVL
jgi:UDP-glucose 4-epimerase